MKRYELIDAEKAKLPISRLCAVMNVTRSGYYAWSSGRTTKRRSADMALGEAIAAIHVESRSTYGSPRVHAALIKKGHRVSRKRVARLMREQRLRGKRRRHFRKTTVVELSHEPAPNVLDRNFRTSAPDQAWAGDITYIWTREGWLYLAVLLDLYSRRVVGWSMSESLETKVAMDALEMALVSRRPRVGLLHHTDRGCQYTSARYRRRLKLENAVVSMSRRGQCWDNAVSESFFAGLKIELVDDADFQTREEARTRIFDYIERFYNRQRLHSYLGYETPEAFENDLIAVSKAA